MLRENNHRADRAQQRKPSSSRRKPFEQLSTKTKGSGTKIIDELARKVFVQPAGTSRLARKNGISPADFSSLKQRSAKVKRLVEIGQSTIQFTEIGA